MSTELYNATTVIGQKYKRAAVVTIENALGAIPKVIFHECDVVAMEGGTTVSTLPNDSCTAIFDINNPLHLDIYNKLNELYIVTREARDIIRNPPAPDMPIEEPPATPDSISQG